jgi:hypothetical protein
MNDQETRQNPTDKARAATEKTIEEIKVASNQLVDRVRDLIEEGNVRRIRVMKDDRTLLEVPLTIAAGAGAAVVLLNPVLAALGALAALLTDVTLVVERDKKAASEQAAIKASDDAAPSDASGDAADGSDKTIGR